MILDVRRGGLRLVTKGIATRNKKLLEGRSVLRRHLETLSTAKSLAARHVERSREGTMFS